jgi:hypothetical protein
MRSTPVQSKLRHFAAHFCDTSPSFHWGALGLVGTSGRRASDFTSKHPCTITKRIDAKPLRWRGHVVREHVVYVHCGEPEALPIDWIVEPMAPGQSATRKLSSDHVANSCQVGLPDKLLLVLTCPVSALIVQVAPGPTRLPAWRGGRPGPESAPAGSRW